MSSGESRAHLLSERLSAVVKEHYAEESQQDYQELERLRLEVFELRGEVVRLSRELSQFKIVDIDGASDDVQEASAAPLHSDFDSSNVLALSCDPNEIDIRLRFDSIAKNKNYIDIGMLVKHLSQNLNLNEISKKKQMRAYESAVHKLEVKLSLPLSAKERKGATGRITFDSFHFLMTKDPDHVKDIFGIDVANALADIREALIDDVIVNQIAKSCHVLESEVEADPEHTDRKTAMLNHLEAVSAAMTVLNALVIGLSLDFAWDGWFGIECGLSGFFVAELLVNVNMQGCADYLFGADWYWSWFDVVIVCFTMADTTLACLDKLKVGDNNVGIDVSVTRLFRLMKITRITRVVRLLRLRVFKEVTLMVNGVVSSLRTIFWAVVVLSICIYVFAVFMRQVVDVDNASKCEAKLVGTSGECTDSELKMLSLGPIMFGSVSRSMVFLFTCFTEGCSSPDGTPFIWLLWDTYGPFLVLLYLVAFVFVSLGVLNLIAAMVVENTMATAVQQEAERLFGQQSHSDNVKKARDLHALLTKYNKMSADVAKSRSAPRKGLRGILDRYRIGKAGEPEMQTGHLHLEISHDQFSEMLNDPALIGLMEELNISYTSRKQLFDILDADGNGFLNVSEVVDGIMKLRGPPDKGDIIAMSLSLNQLQNKMNKLEDRIKVDPRLATCQPALHL